MKKTILTIVLTIILFNANYAQWKQNKFVIGAAPILGISPSTMDSRNYSSSNTFDITADPFLNADITYYKKIKDCYIDLLIAPMELNDNTKLSNLLHQSGFPISKELKFKNYILGIARRNDVNLSVLISDYGIRDWIKNYNIPFTNDHLELDNQNRYPQGNIVYPNLDFSNPAIYGCYLYDEPSTNNNINAINDFLKPNNGLKFSWLSANKPTIITYLNASGNLNYFKGGDNAAVFITTEIPTHMDAYENYLNALDNANPNAKIICYDAYPFRYLNDIVNNNIDKNHPQFLDSYFYGMSILRKRYLPSKKYLWAYVHSFTDDIEGGVQNSMDIKKLQFMAFCPIAYGFKGINYYGYSGSTVLKKNSLGIYDYYFGKGIDEEPLLYTYVQKINKYIKGFVGQIVMDNENIAVLHKNNPSDYTNTTSEIINIPNLITQTNPTIHTRTMDSNERFENYKGIIKSISADDILVGIFSNAPQNPCFVSSDLSNGAAYYLWVVNKETYANGVGTTQTNMTITLRGRHDGWAGSTRALIYKSVDAYNLNASNALQNTLQPLYNSATNETTITIDVLQPGEGRMIQLYVANDIPIKPQAPKIKKTGTYTYYCELPTNITANAINYNWYVDNNLIQTVHTQSYTFINDNCPHTLRCTVTYDDCYTESEKSDVESIFGKKPSLCSSINPCTSIYRPCYTLAYARYSAAPHPTIANTLTVGVKQLTQDELAKLFFDASALAVEKVQSVSVYNKAGELALEVTDIGTEVTNIDLSNLTEGVYTITVNGNNDYKEQQTFEYTVGKTAQQVQEELALDNTAIAGTDQENATEVLQEELYQKLKENTELLDNSETLQSFFLNKEQGSFGTIEKINNALSNYDVATAQALINIWLPTTNLELNCLSYYNNFIKYLNGGTFTTNDVADLYSLANLCPQTNGEVIYAARSLYNYIANDNDEFSYACGNNLARNFVKIKSNNKLHSSNISIYPNPSSGNFSIAFASNTKGVNTINVLDIYGRSVLQQKTIGGTKNININRTLSKGIYTVQITNSATGKTETQKLIISNF